MSTTTARRRLVLAGSLLAATAALLVGCVPSTPAPTPTATASESAAPGETATPAPAPALDLNGTALQNQSFFDQVNQQLIAAGGTLNGAAFVNGLEAAGYPKTLMELTPDRTARNNAADNIEFSVRLNGTCLVGQYGNTGYISTVGQILGDGRCLIGATRPIDF